MNIKKHLAKEFTCSLLMATKLDVFKLIFSL